MKKKIIALAIAAIFCSGSMAAASTNQFSDVPASHWSYGAINELAKAGIIDGFSNGTFQGDKTMTRYEMAQIVANAVTKEDKASVDNKALIEKLVKEYADELRSMGARVTNLENTNDKFHYFGLFGNRYDHMKREGVTDKSSVFIFNTFFKVDDQFTFVTQNELHRTYTQTAEQWNNNGNGYTPNGRSNWQQFGLQAYVAGKFDGMSTKMGRFTYMPAYGISHGEYLEVSGAQVSFGDKVKTTLVAGQNVEYVPQGTFASMGYQAADVVFAVNPATNIKLSYQRNQSNLGLVPAVAYENGALHNSDYINYYEGGFDTKLGNDLAFEMAYIRTSYDTDNKGYYAQLKYKNAIPFVAKSYDLYIAYHNLEGNSIMYNDLRYYGNMKGIRVGAHYAPWDSTLLTVWYDMQKYINAGTSAPYGTYNVAAGEKDNFLRVQLDFFFK